MDTLTRRRFLAASGAAGVAAAGGYLTWSAVHQAAVTRPLATGTPILVLVTLYGGNDGLNTVIPTADPAYLRARTDMAYQPDQVLPLGDGLGLNPALTGLAGLWRAGQLAVIRGVGYPKPDHSHFRSMDIWQSASPDTPVATGWIGRWMDSSGDDPLRVVNIGPVLPPLAVGAKGAAASLALGRDRPLPAALGRACTGLGHPDPTDGAFQALVTASYRAERSVDATFDPVTGAADPGEEVSAAGSAGGQNNLAAQLDLVARCIKAGVPTTVYCVSLGGFDTHADEKGTQETQLGLLDTGVAGFLKQLTGSPRGGDVVVMAYSEFGRRVGANASHGTDHGTAGPVFVAGPAVRGGFYGEQPSLTDLDDGDLKFTVDFRTVYAEVLTRVVRTDPAAVLGPTAPALGFLT